jgi:flagellar biosynthesis protein FlhB
MEKSYQPTAKRLRKSVADGESVEAVFFRSGTLLLGTMLGLYLKAMEGIHSFSLLLRKVLNGDGAAEVVFVQGVEAFVWVAVAPLALGGFCSISGWLCLNGFRWVPHLVSMQGKRLSPAKWFATLKRSPQLLLTRIYGLVGLLVVIGSAYFSSAPETFSARSLVNPYRIDSWLSVLQSLFTATIVLLVVGIMLSGSLGWIRYRRSLMMSREEVVRELKEEEGDPEIKHAIRSQQHQMAYAELRARVKGARVVVVSRSRRQPGGGI